MWKLFSNCGNSYMIRIENNGNDLNLQLTDLAFIWGSRFSASTLVNNFKENNALIEATDEQIISTFLELLQDLQHVDICISSIENNMELKLEKKCSDFDDSVKKQKIIYKFKLNKQEQDEFKNKITVSAIQTIYFLEKQQLELLNTIKKKDRELEEFRMEKGDISRDDLKTQTFDANILNTGNKGLLLNVFTGESNKDFWEKFTEKNGEVQSTNLHIQLEPWNVKSRKRVIHSGKKVVKKGSGIIFNK